MFEIKAIGNCILNLNDLGKKVITFTNNSSWKKPIIDDKLNASYFVPNGDYTVLDIDDLTSEQNKFIFENYSESCKYIVKSLSKGYHMYFKYCEELSNIYKLAGLDIISNGNKMLFCYPTKVEYNGEIREYKIIKNEEPDVIPPTLLNYILTRYNERIKNKNELEEMTEKLVKKNSSKMEDKRIINEFKSMPKDKLIIEDILENINKSRCDDYNDWIKIMMILKNENIEYSVFEKFSMRSEKFDGNVINIWNKYKKGNVKNELSLATLWYMLKQDNELEFNRIKTREAFKNYEFIDYIPSSSFSRIKFFKLFKDDVFILGSKMLSEDVITQTNSFKYFNSHHCKVGTYYMSIEYYGTYKKYDYLPKEFKDSMNEAKIVIDDKKYYFLDIYDELDTKQVYDKIGFEFNLENKKEGLLNLFTGFKYDDINNIVNYEIIKDFIEFIEYVINNKIQSNHFLDWIAHMIQKPHIKQPHCYVLYSLKHGVGKNTIINGLGKIFNGYFFKMDGDRMLDKFNSDKLGKLLCYIDEVKTFKNGDTIHNNIKNMISQTEQSIEFKGKDKLTNIPDRCHYIFTTNNKDNFYIEDGDRRFNMVECNNNILSQDVFKKINEQIETEEFAKNLYNFFKNRNLNNYNPYLAIMSDYKDKSIKKRLLL